MVINELVTQLVSLNRLIVHSQHNITNQHISISAHQSTQRLYQSQLQHLLAAPSTSPLQYITLIKKTATACANTQAINTNSLPTTTAAKTTPTVKANRLPLAKTISTTRTR